MILMFFHHLDNIAEPLSEGSEVRITALESLQLRQ